jgi:hypothetical protein
LATCSSPRSRKSSPTLVAYGRDRRPGAIAYQEFPALLLAEIQRQQHEIHALRARNRQLRHQQTEINWLMHTPASADRCAAVDL